MTDVLEVLREYQKTTWPWAAVRCDHLSAAIAAIEERDAEIGRLRSLRCACDEESGQHDPTCPVTIRDTATAMSEEIATLTRQLAEMDKEASVQRERANGLEYQCGVYEKRIEEINARWSRFFAMCGVNDPPSLADAERMFPQHGTDAFLYTLECSQAVLEGHEAMRSKLARYEQAEREILERTPGWVGEQLPALAAYLAGVEQQRDAMREALREIAERGCSLFLNAVPRRKTPPFCCDDDEPCDGCLARRALGAL